MSEKERSPGAIKQKVEISEIAHLSMVGIIYEYFDLILEHDELWNRFVSQSREFMRVAFKKDFTPERSLALKEEIFGLLDNMGGGFPLVYWESIAFLILQYLLSNNADRI